MADAPRIGIVTISDRASRGEYEDLGGPAIVAYLERHVVPPWQPQRRLIHDDVDAIVATISDLADQGCCLIVTTGGTGPAPRDVTPEATAIVCEKMMPGFGEQMRLQSQKSVPTAILSRATAGIRAQSLIINLPGKPAAIEQCLDAVFVAVPYCIKLIGGHLATRDQ